MTRHECRTIVMKLLFSKLENPSLNFDLNFNELISEHTAKEDDLQFIKNLYESVISNQDDIVELISNNLVGYEWHRVYKVDKCLLMMAVGEINFLKSTPDKVVFNEIIELAKEFSTDKSAKFINGILAKIVGA